MSRSFGTWWLLLNVLIDRILLAVTNSLAVNNSAPSASTCPSSTLIPFLWFWRWALWSGHLLVLQTFYLHHKFVRFLNQIIRAWPYIQLRLNWRLSLFTFCAFLSLRNRTSLRLSRYFLLCLSQYVNLILIQIPSRLSVTREFFWFSQSWGRFMISLHTDHFFFMPFIHWLPNTSIVTNPKTISIRARIDPVRRIPVICDVGLKLSTSRAWAHFAWGLLLRSSSRSFYRGLVIKEHITCLYSCLSHLLRVEQLCSNKLARRSYWEAEDWKG